ncbi:MAG: restriction endonuclease subunit S [Clostridia bacterium]|nr:restriction endonuclease subunit S [Clostridia bacterium]
MKCEWKEKTLGEVTSYISKGIPPKYVENENESTIRVLNQKCNREFRISYFDSRLHDNALKAVPHEKMLMPGDVLINSTGTGTAGRVAQIWDVSVPTTIDGHMILMRPTDEMDLLYYGYVIKSNQRTIESYAEGSTGQTEINKIRLQNEITVRFPTDKSEQQKIGKFLADLDDKIELNERINKNLFAQAQTMYKSRFIDFEPFGGVMPSSWHCGTVSEIIELHDSKRIPLSSRERANLDKVYPYYGATSVMDYVDRYLFDGIYLLLGEDGTVVDSKGYPVLQYVDGKFWVNNHAHIITGKNGFTVETLYLLFSLTSVKAIVTGAVQPKISQANLNKIEVVIPSHEELSRFDDCIQPIFSEIRNLRNENAHLASLRDSLLPRLMSGELDVSNIDL